MGSLLSWRLQTWKTNSPLFREFKGTERHRTWPCSSLVEVEHISEKHAVIPRGCKGCPALRSWHFPRTCVQMQASLGKNGATVSTSAVASRKDTARRTSPCYDFSYSDTISQIKEKHQDKIKLPPIPHDFWKAEFIVNAYQEQINKCLSVYIHKKNNITEL